MIWGENGSGKTSILEAIHVLTYGKSFKTHKQGSLVKKGDLSSIIKGSFSRLGRVENVAVQIEKNSASKIKINKKLISSRKELIGRNNVVVLSPEEQPITKGAPVERRQFFDKMFSVSNIEYINNLQKYNRILKQRNAALLDIREGRMKVEQLTAWDDLLITSAESLWLLRKKHITLFKSVFNSFMQKYDKGLSIKILYKEEILKKEEIENRLKKDQKKDIIRARTSFGPHRDDVKILWDDRDIRDFGSQGEHKLTLVLLKVSEMSFIKENTGIYPILLLDDLFAKLDLERSKKIVTLLSNLKSSTGDLVQTVITTTDLLNVENSGLLKKENESTTYHLERDCNT